ncbi:MAG: dihydrofolate reductase family protein [Bacteroidota bacterium]
MRHYVVSKTLELPESSQVHVVRHNAVDFIKGLKQEEGTPIYLCGGGKLACTLLQNQLIDRLLMKVNRFCWEQEHRFLMACLPSPR